MILQLNPQIPVITPKGTGYAWLITRYSQEHHLIWSVILDEDGTNWEFENPEIKVQWNYTLNRRSKNPSKNGS